MSGYLGSKRPDDIINVTVLRNGKERDFKVKLSKLETTTINELGIEVKT